MWPDIIKILSADAEEAETPKNSLAIGNNVRMDLYNWKLQLM